MKPGDLVRLKSSAKKEDIGVIIGIRVSNDEFHDMTRARPYIYANIMWSKPPLEFLPLFKNINGECPVFELSIGILEKVEER